MRRRRFFQTVLAGLLLVAADARAESKVIYEKASPYNTIVVTEDAQGLRTLRFERYGPRQSVVKVGDPTHLELPYARSLLIGLAVVEDPQRVLVVGLGGGTLPMFLHHHYPEATLDAVDIDPEVIEVARKYFGFREDRRLRAIAEDGRKFIEECRRPYDLIILDAFGDENIPYHLATREFLQAVRRALTPRGIAVGNIWSRSSNPLHDSMVRTYREVFDRLYVVDVPGAGNEILLALPRAEAIEGKDLARRARALSREKGFPVDLGDLVRYGFRSAASEIGLGRVLTDQTKEPPASAERGGQP